MLQNRTLSIGNELQLKAKYTRAHMFMEKGEIEITYCFCLTWSFCCSDTMPWPNASYLIIHGSQDRSSRKGIDTEWRRNVAYLFDLLAFSVSFLTCPEPLAQGCAEPSHLITDQENACRSVLLHSGQSYGSIFSVVAPSSKITITCVNSTKFNN